MIKKNFLFILFFLLLFIPLGDLIHSGLPITHDGQDHVARIANFYQNLQEGVVIPRWAGNLNWGYGHPILMFLYPLPSYFASFFHFLGFSFVDSTKIVFGLAYIFSGIAMYLFVSNLLGRREAVVSALLYVYAPYRFVDLYVRGAIGEHVAFIFPPLVLYCFLKLSRDKKNRLLYQVIGSLSLAGLILSHNAISLMFLPLIFFYASYEIFSAKERKKTLVSYCLLFIFGFGISCFFWAPAFFEGKYTLREKLTAGSHRLSFSTFDKFVYGAWSYGGTGLLSVQVGLMQWLFVLVVSFLTILKIIKRDRMTYLSVVLVVIFFLSLFLMTEKSSFIWEKITILQKFQFPWRFLSLNVFVSALIGGLGVSLFPFLKKTIPFSLIIFGIIFLSHSYWHAKGFTNRPESFYSSIYKGTTDTGESSPIWSVRFMEKGSRTHAEIISGNAKINEIERSFTVHGYQIIAQGKTRILENTLYFPGWNIYVDGKEVASQFQDSRYRGLITFFVEKGEHQISVKFQETKLRLIADIASFAMLVILIFSIILTQRPLWRRFL